MNYQLSLTNSEKKTLVDKEIYESVSQLKWRLSANGYVVRSEGRKVILLHRLVINAHKNKNVDHINCNKLDNRIANLRECTDQENMFNRMPQANNISGLQGINLYKRTRRWRAFIKKNGKSIHLGYFNTAQEALRARNEAVIILFGKFGRVQI